MKATHGVICFTVEGGGQFPLDMLRYDCCAPASQLDVAAIDRRGQRRVALRRYFPVGGVVGPCADRWASFGWRVVSESDAEAA